MDFLVLMKYLLILASLKSILKRALIHSRSWRIGLY